MKNISLIIFILIQSSLNLFADHIKVTVTGTQDSQNGNVIICTDTELTLTLVADDLDEVLNWFWGSPGGPHMGINPPHSSTTLLFGGEVNDDPGIVEIKVRYKKKGTAFIQEQSVIIEYVDWTEEENATNNRLSFSYTTGIVSFPDKNEHAISIHKYNENNERTWNRLYGNTGYNTGRGIASDIIGNNITTGEMQNTIEFETESLTSYGNSDIFLVKNDEDGNEQWAIQAGSTAKDVGKDIITDLQGNSYVVGEYGAAANFDGQILAHTGTGAKGFIAKYNSNGVLIWVKAIEGTTANLVNSIAQNEQGDLFITGFFRGTATFGNETVEAVDEFDLFVAKMDQNGNFLWVKTYENAEGFAITADYFGNALIAARQDDQMLLLKYSNTGVLAAERLITASEKLHAQDITSKCDGTVQVIGQFNGTIYMDGNIIPSLGGQDIFLGDFNSNFATISAKGEGGPLDDYGLGIYNEGTDFTSYVGCHFGTSTINGETTTAPDGSFMPFSTRFDLACDNGGTVSTNDQNGLQSVLAIRPNPFSDNIAIDLNTLQAETLDLKLIDLLGRTIYQEKYEVTTGKQTVDIAFGESLSVGIYLLQIMDERGERHTEKLVKN